MSSALDLLTGDAQAFREDVWASTRHLHDAGTDSTSGLLRLDDVDALVTSSGIRTPAVRVVHQGQVLPGRRFTRTATLAGEPLTGLVDARKLIALVQDGATVVLQGLHRYWPPLIELVARLEQELGHPGQANAYLTPAGAQGFAPHRDTHDVFVIQTEGSKTWTIGDEGEETDLVLTPGMVLYLPTGTRHSARAQDTLSLHITIGINQLTWRSLARRAVLEALDAVPDTHLPALATGDSDQLAQTLRAHLDAVAERLSAVDTHQVVAKHDAELLTGRPPRLAGLLATTLRAEEVDDETVLLRRVTNPGVLIDGPDGGLRLLLGDRSIDLPARLTDRLRPALELVLEGKEFRPADLADHLDDQSRIVLCRRLIREGLLVRVP